MERKILKIQLKSDVRELMKNEDKMTPMERIEAMERIIRKARKYNASDLLDQVMMEEVFSRFEER